MSDQPKTGTSNISVSDGAVHLGPWAANLRRLGQILWRRKGLIVGTVTLVMVIAVILVNRVIPQYTADALVMMDERRTRIVKMEDVLSDLNSNRFSVLSQVEVIRSRELARRVVNELQLDRDPTFNPALAPAESTRFALPSPKELVEMVLPESWVTALGAGRRAEPLTVTEQRVREETVVINMFLSRLNVRQLGLSSVIQISYTSPNPNQASTIANKLADLYVLSQLEAKFEATRKATLWLNNRLTDLREQVEASERAVEEYRHKNNMFETKNGSFLTGEALSSLSAQLILAQTKRAEAEARYGSLRRLIQAGGSLDSSGEVVASPLIQRLREQESLVTRRMSELSTRYGDRHPSMINARAELGDLRSKISAEVRRIADSLKNEMDVAIAREQALQRSLDEAQGSASTTNQASVALHQLEREAEANRLIYQAFLGRFKETSEQQEIQRPDASVISYAAPPLSPSAPRKTLLLSIVILSAVVGAVAIAFMLEGLDTGLRSAEEIEEATGLPVLSMVPLVGLQRRGAITDYIIRHPMSSITESVRNLRTSLRLFSPDNPPRVVCITSTIAGEGKSTLALWLARSAALQGGKVLLVDADLRRPRLAEMLGIPVRGEGAKGSLVDVLLGEKTLDDVIITDEASGLQVICGTDAKTAPHELLSTERMKGFIEELRSRYDLAILDAPPVLAVSDARVLATLSDATLFLIRWNMMERDGVRNALKQLRSVANNVLGTVVTQVNTRKHARYGYLDNGHYYGRYSRYYGTN